MSNSPFLTPFSNLPSTLPVFPLAGAVLFPGLQLPLNIFEPRYVSMVIDALGADRLMGMVQPRGTPGEAASPTAIHNVGCVGRITTLQETGTGGFFIILSGEYRFRVGEELSLRNGYRRIRPDYAEFGADTAVVDIPRSVLEELRPMLEQFASRSGLQVSWDDWERAETMRLVDTICAQFPFEAEVKQAFIEADAGDQRTSLLKAALQMGASPLTTSRGQTH